MKIDSQKPLKITIGLPSNGYLRSETAIALSSAISFTPNVVFNLEAPVGTYIHQLREHIAERALEVGVDYLLFIDSDMVFPPDGITNKLLSRNKEIIGADYNHKFLPKRSITKVLKYVQSGQENPIIQAAIIHLHIRLYSPFESYNGRMARLAEHLILYKNGYDFREMLVQDEYYFKEISLYNNVIKQTSLSQNMTLWLEFYTNIIITGLEKALTKIQNPRKSSILPSSFWKLNKRQKAILTLLEDPNQMLTNQEVQKLFKISQITASRDLAKLTNRGFW